LEVQVPPGSGSSVNDMSLRRRSPAATAAGGSTPVAAVTPTILAVSSGLLEDCLTPPVGGATESEDEMESVAVTAAVSARGAASLGASEQSTVLPPSGSSNVDLIKLQYQVNHLTEIVESRLSNGSGGADGSGAAASHHLSHKHTSELEEENARLHETIAMADKQLTHLRLHTAELETGFTQELNSLKAQLRDAQGQAAEESRQRKLLQRNLESATRGRSGLESYINGLPSKDEFEAIRVKLSEKEQCIERLHTKVAKTDAEKVAVKKQNFALQDSLKSFDVEVSELKLKLSEAEALNRRHSERLSAAAAVVSGKAAGQRSSKEHVEVLMEQKDSLVSENDKLKKYVVFQKARNEKRERELTSGLKSERERCTELETHLGKKTEEAASLRVTADGLRDQVGAKVAEMNQLRKKSGILEDQIARSRNAEAVDTDAEQIKIVIAQKLKRCVKDFQSLTQVSKQILGGDDPNVSMLLGVESRGGSDTEDGEDENRGAESRLNRLHRDLDQLKATQADIRELRQILTDKYAESFAENCKLQ